MKIWEIKAQALRQMFADTDLQFSQSEFENNAVYDNANTREKLVRMEDSIRRAIDLYYTYVGDHTGILPELIFGEDEDFLALTSGQYPTRIDLLVYDEDGVKKRQENDIEFYFDEIAKKIYFFNINYQEAFEKYTLKFRTFYKLTRTNLPTTFDEIEYDLDTINIPSEVQNMIPYFIKGELYEEDEPSIALQARNLYSQFLLNIRKPFTNVQTKVRRANVFNK